MGIGRYFAMKNILPSNSGECLVAQLQTLMKKKYLYSNHEIKKTGVRAIRNISCGNLVISN
jgi:hypothetical protein